MSEQNAKIYRQRRPQDTAPYRIFLKYYDKFKKIYDEKYKNQYGFFRSEIDKEVDKFLKCGIHKYGVARYRCEDKNCRHELYLPFSCKSRSICSSCTTRHMLLFQNFFLDHVPMAVPFRHLVFTIPKVLRKYIIMNRDSLNELSRIAWACIKQFMLETLKVNGTPGGVISIQTHGNLLSTNPHSHCLVTDGLFYNSVFHKMPKYSDSAKVYLKHLFERKAAAYCIKRNFITKDHMLKRLSWQHTGFSVYIDTFIEFSSHCDGKEKDKLEQILRYISKPFFSMNRIIYKEEARTVLYKGGYNKSIKQNFIAMSPTDFIAALTAHVPNHRQRYINYYGVLSSKMRGIRRKEQTSLDINRDKIEIEEPTREQKAYRKSWAMLIQKVFEVDPLICPDCGKELKLVAVIQDSSAVSKILKHIGLWEENNNTRAPPAEALEDTITYKEVQHIPFDDGWSINDNPEKYAA